MPGVLHFIGGPAPAGPFDSAGDTRDDAAMTERHDSHPRRKTPSPSSSPRARKQWYGAMGAGGFGFGLVAERRPFGDDLLVHPLMVYFIVVGLALLALRMALGRPVPDVIPERALVLGCFIGLALFLAGNLSPCMRSGVDGPFTT